MRSTDRAPFFTVLVPTYNQAHYLGAALESLIGQTDPDWEAIVVNDGSTDATADVLAAYCARDQRFRGIHKENGGVASALNAGLRQARGEWVCWLSSDDLFEAHKLSVHRDWIGKCPECSFFFTNARVLDEATGFVSDTQLKVPRKREWQVLEMLRCGYVHGNSICVNREAWARAGEFDEKLRNGQDYDMWLRLLGLYPGTFIPDHTCVTRYHFAQDSQRFVKAGEYDSAYAAIRFLNQHIFAELVPWVELRDKKMAETALAKALDVAGDSSGYLYALGPHPALLLRAMEWAWSGSNEADARSLQRVVRRWTGDTRWQHSGTAMGFYWKIVDVAAHLPERRFEYRDIPPLAVARRNYHLLRRANKPEAESLGRYLARFGHLVHEDAGVIEGLTREIVIVCRKSAELSDSVQDADTRTAVRLGEFAMEAGHQVLLVGVSRKGMGFIDGVPFLGVESDGTCARAAGRLGRVDAVVGMSRTDLLRMPFAQRRVIYAGGETSFDDASVDLLNRRRSRVVCSSGERRAAIIARGVLPELVHVAEMAGESGVPDGQADQQTRGKAPDGRRTLLEIIESSPRRRSAAAAVVHTLSFVRHVRALARRILRSRMVAQGRTLWWLLSSTPPGRWPVVVKRIRAGRRRRRPTGLS
jgi:glycosyltransferase involved in cell wall biosynthesis